MKNLKYLIMLIVFAAAGAFIAGCNNSGSGDEHPPMLDVTVLAKPDGCINFSVTHNGAEIVHAAQVSMGDEIVVTWLFDNHYNGYAQVNGYGEYNSSPATIAVTQNMNVGIVANEDEKYEITLNNLTGASGLFEIEYEGETVNTTSFLVYKNSYFTIKPCEMAQRTRLMISNWFTSPTSLNSTQKIYIPNTAHTYDIYMEYYAGFTRQNLPNDAVTASVGGQEITYLGGWVRPGEEVTITLNPDKTTRTVVVEGADETDTPGVWTTKIDEPKEILIKALMHQLTINCGGATANFYVMQEDKEYTIYQDYISSDNYSGSRTFSVFDNEYVFIKATDWVGLTFESTGLERIEPLEEGFVYFRVRVTAEATVSVTAIRLPQYLVKFKNIGASLIGQGAASIKVVWRNNNWENGNEEKIIGYTSDSNPQAIWVYEGYSIYLSGYSLLPGHTMTISEGYYRESDGAMRVVVTGNLEISFRTEDIGEGIDAEGGIYSKLINNFRTTMNLTTFYKDYYGPGEDLTVYNHFLLPLAAVSIYGEKDDQVFNRGTHFLSAVSDYAGGKMYFAYDSFGVPSPIAVGSYTVEVTSPTDAEWEWDENPYWFAPKETGTFTFTYTITLSKDLLYSGYGIEVDEDIMVVLTHTLEVV